MKNTKVSFIQFIFLSCFVIIAARAFYIQIYNSDKLISYFESQLLREVKIYPKRGNIYDRNGAPLAINIQTYSIFTFPQELKNKKQFVAQLKKIIPDLNFAKISKDLATRDRFTWIARNWKLSTDQKQKLERIDGVYLEETYSRFYPNSELASQVIGFVGIDNAGLAGVEHFFNEKLKGKEQVIKYFKDAKGRPIRQKSEIAMTPAIDLELAIDKNLQAAAERFLKEAIEHHRADGGGFGVINALNGEILAMGNYPNFDANEPQKYPSLVKKLPFVSDPFETGSVIKTFTIASALDRHIVSLETNYYCENGELLVDNHRITEADRNHYFEWLSVEGILVNSSNIGTSKIAFDLGYPKLMESFEQYNLTSKTGIENSGESKGIFQDDKDFSRLRLSNMSFGQGVANTGIQILSGYAAIINDGVWVQPTLLKNGSKKHKRILNSTTANALKNTLIKAVREGTGTSAAIEHFTVGGKTGTAQRISESGGYKGYISSFAGFMDLGSDKKVAIYIYLDNPKENGFYGGVVAGPVFKKIAKTMVFKNKSLATLANVEGRQSTKIIDQLQIKRSAINRFDQNQFPSFIGLDKTSAKSLAKSLNLKLEISGYGIVRSQYPLAGSEIKKNRMLNLTFAKPQYD